MSNDRRAFGPFLLEGGERRLSRDGSPVELSGRYLDALLLLACHPGELITKDRFMAEVWRGIPVTDEALTQCIRSLRKALGDDAAQPRFIETVPRHGYRFVAEVSVATLLAAGGELAGMTTDGAAEAGEQGNRSLSSDRESHESLAPHAAPQELKGDSPFKSPQRSVIVEHPMPNLAGEWLLVTAAGLAGGAGAGLIGGIGYGLLAATDPPAGTGAISILLVMTCVCLLVGVVGGAGVSAGLGAGRLLGPGRLFPVMLGGALGGLVVGSLGRLIGLDAFSLLIGSRPLAITGGSEGLLIGTFAGAALWWAERRKAEPLGRTVQVGALLGAAAGLLIGAAGGKMMAGSLAVLGAAHPDAPLGRALSQLPPQWLLAAGAVEGAIFLGALSLSFALALRGRGPN